jgi:putative transposase
VPVAITSYSESLFKTVKYHYTFPESPFKCLSEASGWVEQFMHWYNDNHQHSEMKFVTPNQRHNGLDRTILENRKKVMEQARRERTERSNRRKTRNLMPIEVVYLNPGKDENNVTENKLQLKMVLELIVKQKVTSIAHYRCKNTLRV